MVGKWLLMMNISLLYIDMLMQQNNDEEIMNQHHMLRLEFVHHYLFHFILIVQSLYVMHNSH